MPVAFARACQYFADHLGIKAEISLEPLALTAEQVERYGLPKAPDKQQTELDALEADYPGELARILRAAVEARRDGTLEERLGEAQRDADQAVAETWEEATAGALAGLELRTVAARSVLRRHARVQRARDAKIARRTASQRRRIAAIQREISRIADEVTAEFEPALHAAERAGGNVNDWLADCEQQIRQLAEETEFDLPDRPEPEVEVDDSGVLYDSRRHWLDQLKAFKAAKGGAAGTSDDEPEDDEATGSAA